MRRWFFFVKVFVGLGFHGGLGPQVNETYDNAGYGVGGISWLTHTSINRTNLFDNNQRRNSYPRKRKNENINYKSISFV